MADLFRDTNRICFFSFQRNTVFAPAYGSGHNPTWWFVICRGKVLNWRHGGLYVPGNADEQPRMNANMLNRHCMISDPGRRWKTKRRPGLKPNNLPEAIMGLLQQEWAIVGIG